MENFNTVRDEILKNAYDNSNLYCMQCGEILEEKNKNFFTFFGNVNVANEGGLIGNNFDKDGKLRIVNFLHFDCTIKYFKAEIDAINKIRNRAVNVGDDVLCWDSRIWRKLGINRNEDCWKTAEVLDIRRNVKCCENTDNEHIHDVLIDVKFRYDGYVSKGHFPSNIKKL